MKKSLSPSTSLRTGGVETTVMALFLTFLAACTPLSEVTIRTASHLSVKAPVLNTSAANPASVPVLKPWQGNFENFFEIQGEGNLKVSFQIQRDGDFKTKATFAEETVAVVKISSPNLLKDRLESIIITTNPTDITLQKLPVGLVNVYVEILVNKKVVASAREDIRIVASNTVTKSFTLQGLPNAAETYQLTGLVRVQENGTTVSKLAVNVLPTQVYRNENITVTIAADDTYQGKFYLDFGDGIADYFESRAVIHQYPKAGIYTVKASAPAKDGYVYENKATITVLDSTTPTTLQYPASAEITAIEPQVVSIGDKLTLKGRSFSNIPAENTVLFNGKPARVLSATGQQLEVEVPAGATLNSTVVVKRTQPLTDRFLSLVPVSEGTEGDFNPTQNLTLQGTHQYNSIRIPSGVTVRAEGNSPLIMYANGDVVIDGMIDASGKEGKTGRSLDQPVISGNCPWAINNGFRFKDYLDPTVVNPGGIAGAGGTPGRETNAMTQNNGGAGTYNGTDTLTPLVGGNGGGSGDSRYSLYSSSASCAYSSVYLGASGGGGGGIVKIITNGKLVVNGQILAQGGNGGLGGYCGDRTQCFASGGSGGAIWLASKDMDIKGQLSVSGGQGGSAYLGSSGLKGGAGGVGRIRMDTDTLNRTGTVTPSIAYQGKFTDYIKQITPPTINTVSNSLSAMIVPREKLLFRYGGDAAIKHLVYQMNARETVAQVLANPNTQSTSLIKGSVFSGGSLCGTCKVVSQAENKILWERSGYILEDMNTGEAKRFPSPLSPIANESDPNFWGLGSYSNSVYGIVAPYAGSYVRLDPTGQYLLYTGNTDANGQWLKDANRKDTFAIYSKNLTTGQVRSALMTAYSSDYQVSIQSIGWGPDRNLTAFSVNYDVYGGGISGFGSMIIPVDPASLSGEIRRQLVYSWGAYSVRLRPIRLSDGTIAYQGRDGSSWTTGCPYSAPHECVSGEQIIPQNDPRLYIKSPDGKYGAYLENAALVIKDMNGGTSISLPELGAWGYNGNLANPALDTLSWSPDSTTLAVASSKGVYLVSPDGKTKINVYSYNNQFEGVLYGWQ